MKIEEYADLSARAITAEDVYEMKRSPGWWKWAIVIGTVADLGLGIWIGYGIWG